MKSVNRILAVIVVALAYFCLADAQPAKKVPRIGFVLSTGAPGSSSELLDAFRRGLREFGYVEGKNISIEIKYAMGRLDLMPALVNEFVQENVDVLVGVNNVVIRAAKEATKTIPIVMVTSIDPVAAGYVKSFAHPSGNVTGVAYLSREVSGKRLELLKELLPKISRVGLLWDAAGPGPAVAVKEYAAAARAFNMDLKSLEVRDPKPDFEGVIQAAKKAGTEAIVVVGNPLIGQYENQIFQIAMKNRIPTMTEDRRRVVAGGLISYGASLSELYWVAARYVDGILKGAKPADMLVQQASVFEIFINLKTAKQLGLEIPRRVLLRANEVIE